MKKKNPNRLIVDDAVNDDNSVRGCPALLRLRVPGLHVVHTAVRSWLTAHAWPAARRSKLAAHAWPAALIAVDAWEGLALTPSRACCQVVSLHLDTMTTLQLFRGDTVQIKVRNQQPAARHQI